MKLLSLALLCIALPFSLFADSDAFRGLMRDILVPPVQQPQAQPEVQVQTPQPPREIQQMSFNPDYPNVYLGDNGSEKESIFVEMVMYGQTQQGSKHFVAMSGRSSQGAFQKKIVFNSLEEMLHFQGLLESKDYERIYFYTANSPINEADYVLLKKPRRSAN